MIYTREAVEALVPTIFDRSYVWGLANERQPEGDMPRAPRGKKNDHNTLWAHLVDIRIAWQRAPLTLREAQAVVLIGGIGMTHSEAGTYLGIGKHAAREAYERGIGRLCDRLNGTTIQDEFEEFFQQ